jgi:protein-arginine kinase activator protein McsA
MSRVNFNEIFGSESDDYFDSIIEKFQLEASYDVYQNEDDEIIIDEQWKSSESNRVAANRFFKFDPNFLDLIKDQSKRIEVLNKVLDIYVQVENYEDASQIRDLIQSL